MEKYIFAFIMMLMVTFIIVVPFNLIIKGFVLAATGSFVSGVVLVTIGCIILRLVKPISIITGKDYKVF